MIKKLHKVLGTALIAGAVIGSATTANAALVVGVFDPDFGGNLTGTNFSGTVQFEIAQACLDPGWSLFVYRDSTCGIGGSGEKFDFAHVVFSGGQSGTVDFVTGQLQVLGMYVEDHHVIGVQTTLSNAVGATGGLAGNSFEIIFGRTNLTADQSVQEPGPPIAFDGDNDLDDFPSTDFQVTSLVLAAGSAACSTAHPCPSTSNPAATRFVPEPTSLALVLGALGAGWLTRSKRRPTGAALAA